MIVMISGQIGSGKDTFCDLFRKHSTIQWENKKFAFKLKQIVALLTGCKVEDLESEEFKNQFLPSEFDLELPIKSPIDGSVQHKTTQYTYRELLQKMGTELLRNGFHPQVHINALFADYKPLYGHYPDYGVTESGDRIAVGMNTTETYPNWMVTDMRFENEFESAEKYKGITIRVERSMSCCDWVASKYFKDIYFTNEALSFLSSNTESLTKNELTNMIDQASKTMLKYPRSDKNWLKLIHQSETDLNFFVANGQFDFVIHNDSTLEVFEEKVQKLVKQIENGRY